MDLHDLRQGVQLGLDMADAEATVVAAEVCASWCERQLVRVRYDADHPTDGVQMPQTLTTCGIGILVVVEDHQGRRIGFGSDSDDLSREGIIQALERAKANAVADPDFRALPRPPARLPSSLKLYDPQVMTLSSDEVVRLANEAFNGALTTFKEAGYVSALRVDGDVCSRMEHLVVGNTNGLLAGETSTGLLATVYSRLMSEQSQGTGSHSATHVDDLAAYDAGAEAAREALQARQGGTLAAGDYAVIFGPKAVADLLQDLLLPALSLDTVAAGTSPLSTRLGHQVASPLLTISDEGRLPGKLGSHTITGEGLPTGSTPLVDQGRLVGFLTDTYHACKLAARVGMLPAHNGMRFTTSGQSFGMRPGIFPTNVTLTSHMEEPLEALLAALTDGIYVGGLWYTCPQGGLQTGEFTARVVGPSFHIRQGRLERPLSPGTLRLHDNICDLLRRVTGVSTTKQAVTLATGQSLVLAPSVRCRRARFVA